MGRRPARGSRGQSDGKVCEVAMGNAGYTKYLNSPHWQATRNAAIDRAKGKCALCATADGVLNVHHNTYTTLGNEGPEDLVVLCELCHKRFHGLSDNAVVTDSGADAEHIQTIEDLQWSEKVRSFMAEEIKICDKALADIRPKIRRVVGMVNILTEDRYLSEEDEALIKDLWEF